MPEVFSRLAIFVEYGVSELIVLTATPKRSPMRHNLSGEKPNENPKEHGEPREYDLNFCWQRSVAPLGQKLRW